MTPEKLWKLEKLGIDMNKTTEEIAEDLLNICWFLWEESEKSEEQRFREELYKITKNPSN